MRIDFYTQPHKDQRKQMFALSMLVGETNFSDNNQLNSVEKEFSKLLSELRHHVVSEETFVHPLLIKKMPGQETVLHHEHEELEMYLNKLEDNFKYLKSLLSKKYIKSQEQSLEFYRGLNRFIAEYLIHINQEEYIMQNLWEIALDPELRGMMIAFQVQDGVEKGEKWLSSNLPEMNSEDRLLMFKTTQLMAPEKIFNSMCKLTEEIIGVQEWKVIRDKL